MDVCTHIYCIIKTHIYKCIHVHVHFTYTETYI